MTTTTFARIARTTAALGLALCMTVVALGSLNHLATEQHAATVLAKAAAAQQAQASAAAAAQRS
ncbi:MAG: hypothetical protein V4795_20185 [Pseudomonadota bacterium]